MEDYKAVHLKHVLFHSLCSRRGVRRNVTVCAAQKIQARWPLDLVVVKVAEARPIFHE